MRLLCRLYWIAVLLISLSCPMAMAAAPGSSLILCYHHVDAPAKNEYTVTPDDLRAQLAWLKQEGFSVIPLSRLVDAYRGKGTLPAKAVALTFDDGWRCTNEKGLPILKELGLPCTLFLYPTMIGKKGDKWSYEEYKALPPDAQVEIGCHSFNHPNLLKEGGKLVGQARQDFLQKEYVKSKEILEKNLGRPIRWMSYPYGLYDAEVCRLVKATGYEAAFSVNAAPNSSRADPMFLNRVMILKSDGLKGFKRKVQMLPLEVSGVQPVDGATINGSTRTFTATVVDPEVDLSTVRMTVAGRGKCMVNPKTGQTVVRLDGELKPRAYQISITGRDKKTGRVRLCSWLIRVAGAGSSGATGSKTAKKPTDSASTEEEE